MTSRNEGRLINLILNFWQSRHGIIRLDLIVKITVVWRPHEEKLNNTFFRGQVLWFIQSRWDSSRRMRWFSLLTSSTILPLMPITTTCYVAHCSCVQLIQSVPVERDICENRFSEGWQDCWCWQRNVNVPLFDSTACVVGKTPFQWYAETVWHLFNLWGLAMESFDPRLLYILKQLPSCPISEMSKPRGTSLWERDESGLSVWKVTRQKKSQVGGTLHRLVSVLTDEVVIDSKTRALRRLDYFDKSGNHDLFEESTNNILSQLKTTCWDDEARTEANKQ